LQLLAEDFDRLLTAVVWKRRGWRELPGGGGNFGTGGSMRGMRSLSAVVLVLALVAAACGDGDAGGGGGGDGQKSVGMALPGPKNDKAFNQVHYEGLLAAGKKHGVATKFIENVVDPQARIDAMKNLAADNDLVIGVGGEYAEPGVTVAPQFPDVKFAVINGEAVPPNLHTYFVRQGVPAYVAGVIAADLTQTKKVGFVGGELIPPTTQSDDGFKAGVQSIDSSIEYVSTIVGNFNDAEKAKEAAAAQINAGADVIFGMVDAGFPGVVQAATESGKEIMLFNVIFPRCDEGANVVGAAILNSLQLVDTIVSDFLNNKLPAEAKFYGVENLDVQSFGLCPGFEKYQAQVDGLHRKLAAGEVDLPEGV
jgi:basic membrane protein A